MGGSGKAVGKKVDEKVRWNRMGDELSHGRTFWNGAAMDEK